MSRHSEPAGFTLDEPIGGSRAGEVWRGRDADGDRVRLTLLRGCDGLVRDRLRRDAAILSSVAGEHLLRVRDVVAVADDEAWLVSDGAAGGSLDELLAGRGHLPAPEVVTLVGPLAAALADAHDRGLVHGDVGPATVVFDAGGRPLLADLGVALALGIRADGPYAAPEVAAGQAPGPAADVFALCAVAAAALLAGACSPELRAALEAGAAADPDDRPTARELSSAVLRSGAAAPIPVAGRPPEPPATPDASAAERAVARPPADTTAAEVAGRRVPVAAVAAVVLVVAVVGGAAWGRHSGSAAAVLPRPGSVVATPSASRAAPAAWLTVVARLDRLRARAFDTGDEQLLRAVYAPGAAASVADVATLHRLTAARLRVRGFAVRPLRVRVRSAAGDRAVLAVTDVMTAYVVVDGRGRTVRSVPRRAARTWTMTLLRSGGQWRIAAVSRRAR